MGTDSSASIRTGAPATGTALNALRTRAASAARSAGLTALRMPSAGDPAPPVRRMILLSAWAAILAVVGIAVAAQAFVVMVFAARVPAFFEPAVIVVGLAGIAATVAAFLTVHDRRLPWLLLGAASAALGTVLALTAAVA